MNKALLLFSLTLTLSFPAFAQETPVDSDAGDIIAAEGQIESADTSLKTSEDAAYEERLKLARDMHKIWPIRPKIERALDRIAEQIEPQNRLRFKSTMRKAINFNTVEETSVQSMADIFTADELTAMIAFYGSKEGRSVSFKTDDYERALQPVLIKMLDKAILDTKLGQ